MCSLHKLRVAAWRERAVGTGDDRASARVREESRRFEHCTGTAEEAEDAEDAESAPHDAPKDGGER